jgi:tRNA(fMet)-specific endonuclease VapC
MYLFDTDILTHFFRKHPKLLRHIGLMGSEEIATSIISKIEVLQGRMDFLLKAATTEQVLRAQFWLEPSELLLQQFPIILFDENAGDFFEKPNEVPSYRKLGRADLLITSVALANRATLVTRNTKDFSKISGLSIENWLD